MAKTKRHIDQPVEAFIRNASPAIRPVLQDLRELVRSEIPEATEEIKWGVPSTP